MKELLLTTFPRTKEQQELVAQRWAEQAINGEVDAIEAEVYMASIENTIKAYRANKELRQHLFDTIEHEGGKIKVGSVTLATTETSVTYGYEDCKRWRDLDRQIEELTAKRKLIETALRNATPDTPYYDDDFNVISGIKRNNKYTIKVTIDKK